MFVVTRKWQTDWLRLNPVLINGEIGQEINTGRLKIGDGKTAWNDLTFLPMSGPGGGGGGTPAPITISSITDATTIGKALLAVADQTAARNAIGAGTSNLSVGTTATDAKRGDYVPTWAELGMVPSSALPPLAINDVTVVASQAAMLALTAQRGDMAIRSDNSKTYVLSTDSPSTLADWKEITAANAVVSVNGKTGTVVIGIADISGLQTALDAKLNTADVTPATDLVTNDSLTTTLSPYAKTVDVNAARDAALGPYLKLPDLTDIKSRLQVLESNAGQPTPTRPSRPGTAEQPDFWLRADHITQASGAISAWADEVNGLNFSVPTGRVAPTYQATGLAGKPCASFSKSAISGLYYPKPLKAEDQTIFVVFSIPALGVGTGLLQAVTVSDFVNKNLNINEYISTGNAVVAGVQGNTGSNAFSTDTISAANTAVISRTSFGTGSGVGTNSAKALRSSLNGGTIAQTATQGFTAALSDGLALGGSGAATTANASDIKISEVIIFKTDIATASKQAWTQYLATTFGITIGAN